MALCLSNVLKETDEEDDTDVDIQWLGYNDVKSLAGGNQLVPYTRTSRTFGKAFWAEC